MSKQFIVKTWIGLIVLALVVGTAAFLITRYSPQANTKTPAGATDLCQGLRDQIASLSVTINNLADEIASEQDLIDNLPDTDPTYMTLLRAHYQDLIDQRSSLETALASCTDQKKDPNKQCQALIDALTKQIQQINDEINRINASIGNVQNPNDQLILRRLIDSLAALRQQMLLLSQSCRNKPTPSPTNTKSPTTKPTPIKKTSPPSS